VKLELRKLGRIYRGRKSDVRALGPVSFGIEDGEFVSLIGPSGCGMFTTLYLMECPEAATGGEILLDAEPVRAPGRDRRMGFQNHRPFPWRTVIKDARSSFEFEQNRDYSLTSSEAMNKVVHACHLLGVMELTDFYNAYPRNSLVA
jgi:ABC-type nitrate/sulfonate/bicarbonate transport system ATPase subunit